MALDQTLNNLRPLAAIARALRHRRPGQKHKDQGEGEGQSNCLPITAKRTSTMNTTIIFFRPDRAAHLSFMVTSPIIQRRIWLRNGTEGLRVGRVIRHAPRQC